MQLVLFLDGGGLWLSGIKRAKRTKRIVEGWVENGSWLLKIHGKHIRACQYDGKVVTRSTFAHYEEVTVDVRHGDYNAVIEAARKKRLQCSSTT